MLNQKAKYVVARINYKCRLLKRKILRIIKTNNEVMAYKENGCWYVDDNNGFSKEDNMLVLGVPELIERLVGREARKVCITYKTKSDSNLLRLELVKSDYVGSTYKYLFENIEETCWLCPVFFWYFPKVPREIYISINAIS
jgi:hypothetical protein